MKKKILWVLIIVLLLSGCGNDGKLSKEDDVSAKANIEDVNAPSIAKKIIKNDPVEGIEVSKKELDKLIPLAKQLRLDEKKLTFTAKMLKKVGLDFNLINDDDRDFRKLGMWQKDEKLECKGKERTSIITVRTGNNENYIDNNAKLEIRVGANEFGDDPSEAIEIDALYEIGRDGALNPKYYLYNLMKEGASIKPFFVTQEDAKRLKNIAMNYVESTGEKIDQSLMKKTVIPVGNLKDDQGSTISYYSVPVVIVRVSKVYGEGEERKIVYVNIDINGNVIGTKLTGV